MTQLPLRLLTGAKRVRLARRSYKGHLSHQSRYLHTCRYGEGKVEVGGSRGGALKLILESFVRFPVLTPQLSKCIFVAFEPLHIAQTQL